MKFFVKTFECNLQADLDDDFLLVQKFFKGKVDIEFTRIQTQVKLEHITDQIALPNDGTCDNIYYLFDRLEQPTNGYSHTLQFSNKTSLSWSPTQIPEDAIGFHWKVICHELMHAFSAKLRGKGIYTNVDLEIDKYDQNNDPYSPTGNFSRALKILAPYWALIGSTSPVEPSVPQVTITRQIGGNGETLGDLSANGFSCKTLELPFTGNLPNISCIPTGTYQVKYTFSPRLLKYTYEVQNVPNRSGIRIHSANYYYELKGCIALGSRLADLNGDGRMDVTSSRATIQKFEDFMQRKPFTLKVELKT